METAAGFEPAIGRLQRLALPDLAMLSNGVTGGARTRDIQSHSLALYQLSYSHHDKLARRKLYGLILYLVIKETIELDLDELP